jgi:hypothetical protein
MPIVFCPPSVSALKISIARYFSGSRAALTVGSNEGLAVAGAGELLALADVLVFVAVSDRWQALTVRHNKPQMKMTVNRLVFGTIDSDRAARSVLQTAVFISFSEEFERQALLLKGGCSRGLVE